MKIFLRVFIAWIISIFFVELDIITGCFSFIECTYIPYMGNEIVVFLCLLINILAFIALRILMVLSLIKIYKWAHDAF